MLASPWVLVVQEESVVVAGAAAAVGADHDTIQIIEIAIIEMKDQVAADPSIMHMIRIMVMVIHDQAVEMIAAATYVAAA